MQTVYVYVRLTNTGTSCGSKRVTLTGSNRNPARETIVIKVTFVTHRDENCGTLVLLYMMQLLRVKTTKDSLRRSLHVLWGRSFEGEGKASNLLLQRRINTFPSAIKMAMLQGKV